MSKLIIENNAFDNLCMYISNYYKAGYIAVIYESGYESLALDLAAALDKCNYRSHTVSAKSKLAEKLSDEYRYIVGVGAVDICNVLKSIGKPYCVCLTKPTLRCFDTAIIEIEDNLIVNKGRIAELVIIDKKHLITDWESSLWGEIMHLMQIIVDYSIIRHVTPYRNSDIFDKTLKIIDEISLYDTVNDDKLFEIYLEIVKLYTDLTHNDINITVQIAASLIAYNKNIDYGDACMLCVMYYFHAVYALIGSDIELAFPPDKDALTEQISRKFGLSRVMNTRGQIIQHDIIMRYDYVINEYSTDVRQMISDRFVNMNNACKIWRRLKCDVGYGISRAVTIREIGETVGYASLFGRGYGILRHYKEMGVA